MNKTNNAAVMDIAFLALLILFFGGMLFFAIDAEHIVENGVVICGAVVVLLITYFTSLRTGLLWAAATVFLLFAYTLFYCTNTGKPIPVYVYFFMLWLPLITLALSTFTRRAVELRNENKLLQGRAFDLSMVDDATGLKNLRFFAEDAKRAMFISARGVVSLYMIVWTLQHEQEVFQRVNKSDYDPLKVQISQIVADSVGNGDEVYLLSHAPYSWGTLMFSDEKTAVDTAKNIHQRTITWHSENNKNLELTLNFNFGIYRYDGSDMNSFALLQKAKDNLNLEGKKKIHFAQNFQKRI